MSINKKDKDNVSEISRSYISSNNMLIDNRHEKQAIRLYEPIVKPNTLLPLSIITYYNFLYSLFYLISVAILFIYKGFVLPYPPQSIGPEIAGFIFFMIIQFFRIRLVNQGNKSEVKSSLLLSILLSIPVIMGVVYLLKYQAYVLVFDLGLNIFFLIYTGAEVIFSIVGLFWFKN